MGEKGRKLVWGMIVASGDALVLLFGTAMKGAAGLEGSSEWWGNVLATLFLNPKFAPVAWPTLGVFALGSFLNLRSCGAEIRRPRVSILEGMLVVGLAAVFCCCLRQSPVAGLFLVLLAIALPGSLSQAIRRGCALVRGPDRGERPAS